MAVKDGEKYLHTAIDSVLNQTFSDFEFIIVNDGSGDATENIIHEYSDSRIVPFTNQHSLGLSKSLNIGLEKACGVYVARMDADDVSLPNRFELQIDYLDAHPDIAVLGTAFSFIDASGSLLASFQFPLSHEIIAWSLAFYNPIVHPSVMMRTSIVKALGAYDPELRRSQDYDLWWRISFSGKLANLADTLLLLRQHPTQVTRVYGPDQLAHGIEVNARYLSKVMRQSVPDTLIKKMWSSDVISFREAVRIGSLIWKWYRINTARIRSSVIKSFITHDALNKFKTLITRFLAKSKFFLWLLSTIRTDV